MEKQSLKSEFPGAVVREARLEGADVFFADLKGAGTMLYAIRGGREYVMVAILGFGDAGGGDGRAQAGAYGAAAVAVSLEIS